MGRLPVSMELQIKPTTASDKTTGEKMPGDPGPLSVVGKHREYPIGVAMHTKKSTSVCETAPEGVAREQVVVFLEAHEMERADPCQGVKDHRTAQGHRPDQIMKMASARHHDPSNSFCPRRQDAVVAPSLLRVELRPGVVPGAGAKPEGSIGQSNALQERAEVVGELILAVRRALAAA